MVRRSSSSTTREGKEPAVGGDRGPVREPGQSRVAARAAARRRAQRQRRIVGLTALAAIAAIAITGAVLVQTGHLDLAALFGAGGETAAPSASGSAAQESRRTATTTVASPEAAAAPAVEEPPALPLSGYTIAIDPGHQAKGNSSTEPIGPGSSQTKAKVTTGGTGVGTGTPESAVNLAVSLRVRDALAALGANVVMIRTTQEVDISNAERSAIANNAGADLFIRIHCNGSSSQSTRGLMTLVPGKNTWTGPIVETSRAAAEAMHPLLIAATTAKDLGIIERTDLTGFNYCTVPSVLFELGYLSNPDDDRLLNSDEYQQTIAGAIAGGAVAYLQ